MTTPQQFGEYLLFRRLTTDGLGETYRAGKIGSQGIERVVLLRLFNGQGIESDSLWRTIADRMGLHRILQNPHIGDGADVGRVGSTPYVAYEYVSGKNLAELLQQARARAFHIPTEHSLFIMERVTFGLSAAYSSRHREQRVQHGFLIPENVLLSNEGEVRLIGFESAPALRKYLDVALVRESFAPYLAPEITATTAPSSTDDVFALGSMLFELLTGNRLVHNPEGVYDPLIDEAMLAAEEQPLPPALRALLKSSLAPKQQRIGDVQQWQQAFGRFIADAQYSPTTFNLAFFMHTLFGGEIEQESVDIAREKATQVDVQALAQTQVAAEPTPGPSDTVLIPPTQAPEAGDGARAEAGGGQYGAARRKGTNWKLLAPLAILAVGGGLGAAYYMSEGRKPKNEIELTESEVAAAAASSSQLAELDAEPMGEGEASLLTPGESPDTGSTLEAPAPEAAIDTAQVDVPETPDQIEERIRQLVEDRTGLLEARYQEQLDQMREELEAARLAEQTAADARVEDGGTPTERVAAAGPSGAAGSPTGTAQSQGQPPARSQPPVQAPAERATQPAAAPARSSEAAAKNQPAAENPPTGAEAVVEKPQPKPVALGDLVAPGPGTTRPQIVRQANPRYPPSARRLNKTATVHLRVLIDENGEVARVERVGDVVGFGFDEAAISAAKRSDWKAPQKNGVRVKMWVDLKIDFRP